MATGELLIDIGMLADIAENCTLPWSEFGSAYQWADPYPTGDGESEETGFRFP